MPTVRLALAPTSLLGCLCDATQCGYLGASLSRGDFVLSSTSGRNKACAVNMDCKRFNVPKTPLVDVVLNRYGERRTKDVSFVTTRCPRRPSCMAHQDSFHELLYRSMFAYACV